MENPNADVRFAISGLDRESKDHALNQEILVQKQIGEFLLRTTDGIVLSADKLQRFMNHVDTFTAKAENARIIGQMFEIDTTVVELPNRVTLKQNLIGATPLSLGTGKRKLLLSVDCDMLDITDTLNPELVPYTMELILLNVTLNKTFSTSGEGNFMTTLVHRFDDIFATDTSTHEIAISHLAINRFDIRSTTPDRALMVHSLLAVVE